MKNLRQHYARVETDAIVTELSHYPEKLLAFTDLFNMKIPVADTGKEVINRILTVFKYYYSQVLYLKKENAEAINLTLEFVCHQFPGKSFMSFEEMETFFDEQCQNNNYYYLGGTTTGYYGPYIWNLNTERKYEVEIFGEQKEVVVVFTDGFVSQGWLRYYSQNEFGAAGWASPDGKIYATVDTYPDLTSTKFVVSLLKHEAQHLQDFDLYPSLLSDSLEFRAKLVELYYYEDESILNTFLAEAKNIPENSHLYASFIIKRIFETYPIPMDMIKKTYGLNRLDFREFIKKIYDYHTQYINDNPDKHPLCDFNEWYVKQTQ